MPGSGRASDTVFLGVSRQGAGWAVHHNGGVLGHARSFEEARQIAEGLARWIMDEGREVDVEIRTPQRT